MGNSPNMYSNVPWPFALQFRARNKQAPFMIRRKCTHSLSVRCRSTLLAHDSHTSHKCLQISLKCKRKRLTRSHLPHQPNLIPSLRHPLTSLDRPHLDFPIPSTRRESTSTAGIRPRTPLLPHFDRNQGRRARAYGAAGTCVGKDLFALGFSPRVRHGDEVDGAVGGGVDEDGRLEADAGVGVGRGKND